jgi:hypothetical protein
MGWNKLLLYYDTFHITGFDINGCLIARGKWNASSGKWKRHPTCPIGQVKMILWYMFNSWRAKWLILMGGGEVDYKVSVISIVLISYLHMYNVYDV